MMSIKLKWNSLVFGVVFSIIAISASAQGIDNSLYTFDFVSKDSMSIEQRAEQWTKLGYEGVTFRIGVEDDVNKFRPLLSSGSQIRKVFRSCTILSP